MAHIYVSRSAVCILRKCIGLHHSSSLQYITRISCQNRKNIISSISRCISDDHYSQLTFQQLHHGLTREIGENESNDISDVQMDQQQLQNQWHTKTKCLKLEKLKKITIQNAITADDVLNIYDKRCDSVMDNTFLIIILRRLNDQLNSGIVENYQLKEDIRFQNFFARVLKRACKLDVVDLLSLLTLLVRLHLPACSNHTESILQLLRHQINDLDLKALMYFGFLLTKIPSTPLSRGLQAALPIIKSARISPVSLKDLSSPQLIALLNMYPSTNVQIDLVLLELYSRESSDCHKSALISLWAYMDIGPIKGKDTALTRYSLWIREVKLKEHLKFFSQNLHKYSVREVEKTLHRANYRYHKKDTCCYNEHFLQSIATCCIKEDYGFLKAANFIYRLMVMGFLSEDLVNYAITLILQSPEEVLQSTFAVESLIAAISASPTCNVNYLEALKVLLQKLSIEVDSANILMLLNLALDLLSIGYYHQPLLEQLTSYEVISQCLAQISDNGFLLRKLLLVHQILVSDGKSSLQLPDIILDKAKQFQSELLSKRTDLAIRLHQIFGGSDFYVSGVLTESFVYIDHLIAVDEKGGLIKVGSCSSAQRNTNITNLNIPANAKRIAILDIVPSATYSPRNVLKRDLRLNLQLLESSGFCVIQVLQPILGSLMDNAKNPFIKSLIDSAVAE